MNSEALYHALLINARIIKIGKKGDRELRESLQKHRSLEEIFRKQPELDESKLKSQKEVNMLTCLDENYPNATTPVLYYLGDLGLLERKTIAVVGTRELNDPIDVEEEKKIIERLVGKGYVIVSGLAMGCDTLAHTETIRLGGKTIAVLGTPLDQYAVKANKELQDLIARDHLLISQYPIGVPVKPYFFSHRNQTTVDLSSEGIVVVRASDKSGTQHAIKACRAQGKTIYVLENNYGKGYTWTKNHKNVKIPNRTK